MGRATRNASVDYDRHDTNPIILHRKQYLWAKAKLKNTENYVVHIGELMQYIHFKRNDTYFAYW